MPGYTFKKLICKDEKEARIPMCFTDGEKKPFSKQFLSRELAM